MCCLSSLRSCFSKWGLPPHFRAKCVSVNCLPRRPVHKQNKTNPALAQAALPLKSLSALKKKNVSLERPRRKTVANRGYYVFPSDIKMPAVRKQGAEPQRRRGPRQSATPTVCVSFPSRLRLDVQNAQFDDVTFLLLLVLLVGSLFYTLPHSGLNQQLQSVAAVGPLWLASAPFSEALFPHLRMLSHFCPLNSATPIISATVSV